MRSEFIIKVARELQPKADSAGLNKAYRKMFLPKEPRKKGGYRSRLAERREARR